MDEDHLPGGMPTATGLAVEKAHASPPHRLLSIELTPSTMLLAAGSVACVWLLLQLWTILLVIGVALMIVGMLVPPIAFLQRHSVRRGLAITLVFVGLFAAVGLLATLTVPTLVAQLGGMVEHLPQAQTQLAAELQRNSLTAPLAQSVRGTTSTELTGKLTTLVFSYSGRTVAVIAYTITALVLALYLIADRDRMRGALFACVPRRFHVRLSRILLNMVTIVGGYVRGQIITSVLMGLFTFLVLTIARVPNAVALSTFAAIADVLPYVGGILAAGPAVLATWSHGLGPTLGVLAALLVYQEFESRFIVPRVYGRALRLPPATVLVSFLVGGQLLGILGGLLALPVAAALRMIVDELRFELPGEDVHDTARLKEDAREERRFERLAAGAPAEEAAAIATEIAEERLHGGPPTSTLTPTPPPPLEKDRLSTA